MNIKEFDVYLSENRSRPDHVILHPSVWNGYWRLKYSNHVYLRFIFRQLGRMFNNKYLYWLGLPIMWEDGLKKYYA